MSPEIRQLHDIMLGLIIPFSSLASHSSPVWVIDITCIRTQEGFAYLAVVIDLYSRRVVGWSMQSRQTTEVVLQALLMAVWQRKQKGKVLIHSDQGSQFTSVDWAALPRAPTILSTR